MDLQDLTFEEVDALDGVVTLPREHLHLDLVDVVLQAGDHRLVRVDDVVGDGVQHGARPAPQQFGVVLGVLAHQTQRRRLAVTDVDEEAVADEHLDLAELDLLHVVEVAGRLEHQEDRLVVELQLGHLVGLEGVFDRQRMELEGGADLGELGLGRLEQADPDERLAVVDA